MTLSDAAVFALSTQCAPNVAPQTVAAIIMTESRGRPFALNVNGGPAVRRQSNATDAASIARRFVAAGYSVDLGLGQINSRNMRKLGLTWNTVFDPCTNIAALGRVLTGNYEMALAGRDPQAALRIAFSLYNTGSSSRGFRNGYVGRVVGNAGLAGVSGQVSTLPGSEIADGRQQIVADNVDPAAIVAIREPAPPAWDLFGRAAFARSSTLPSTTIRRTSVWSD
jgi:type IV secretion system protein VirB1